MVVFLENHVDLNASRKYFWPRSESTVFRRGLLGSRRVKRLSAAGSAAIAAQPRAGAKIGRKKAIPLSLYAKCGNPI